MTAKIQLSRCTASTASPGTVLRRLLQTSGIEFRAFDEVDGVVGDRTPRLKFGSPFSDPAQPPRHSIKIMPKTRRILLIKTRVTDAFCHFSPMLDCPHIRHDDLYVATKNFIIRYMLVKKLDLRQTKSCLAGCSADRLFVLVSNGLLLR